MDDPIDLSEWLSDPCSVITEDQLAEIDLEVASNNPGENACSREIEGTLSTVNVGFPQTISEGLSGTYESHENGDTAYFEELPDVQGYPVLAADGEDRRSQGECAVMVGVSDEQVLTVIMTGDTDEPEGKEPCDWAAKVAELAIDTMTGEA